MMHQIDQQKFLQNSWPQIADCVCNASVGLLKRSDAIPYDRPASGTVIAIDDRLFVATAAHAIPSNPNGGNLWILSERRRHPFDEGVLEFRRYRKASNVDVGYLELDPGKATRYLECQPCAVGRIRTIGSGRAQRHVALLGTPKEFVRLENGFPDQGIVPVVKPFVTTPVAEEDWPRVPFDAAPPRSDTDIFLELPREGVTDLATGDPIVFETAEGYSGGGIWDLGFEPGQMWQPTDVSPFGIQSRWCPNRRYLRAVQILHWLRLIHKDYADLRPTLTRLFPELACER